MGKKKRKKVDNYYQQATAYTHDWPAAGEYEFVDPNLIGTTLHRLMVDEAESVDSTMTLDLQDSFESAVAKIVSMNRKKRADYALDGDPFSNFVFTSGLWEMTPEEAALFNVAQKLARVSSLRKNGRGPTNEAVEDTYLDLAVYGVIAYAIFKSREF